MNILVRFWTWFVNLLGVYTRKQVKLEVEETVSALAMFLKISGTNIDKGLADFMAEVDRLANAVDTDQRLIDQLDRQRAETEAHMNKANDAHVWMAEAHNRLQSVANLNVNLDV